MPSFLQSTIKTWLGNQGIEVATNASLVINADASLINQGHNRRLRLSFEVEDLAGNTYGYWHNNPAIIALPQSDHVAQDLFDVQIATQSQQQDLDKMLHHAFTQVVARGGLVRQIHLPKRLMREPEKLHSLLSTLGGTSDVAISQQHNEIIASLRYSGDTGELAMAVHQALTNLSQTPLPAIEIQNDFTLVYR